MNRKLVWLFIVLIILFLVACNSRFAYPLEMENIVPIQTVPIQYEYGNFESYPHEYQICWIRWTATRCSAQAMLGWMYETGTGVPQNYGHAEYFYRRAAEQGNIHAQTLLDRMVYDNEQNGGYISSCIDIPELLLVAEIEVFQSDTFVYVLDADTVASINISELDLNQGELASLVAIFFYFDENQPCGVGYSIVEGIVERGIFYFNVSQSGIYGIKLAEQPILNPSALNTRIAHATITIESWRQVADDFTACTSTTEPIRKINSAATFGITRTYEFRLERVHPYSIFGTMSQSQSIRLIPSSVHINDTSPVECELPIVRDYTGNLTNYSGTNEDVNMMSNLLQRNEGIIPNEETAISVAIAIWTPIYGDVSRAKPFVANYNEEDGYWEVRGTLPENMRGGVPIMRINRRDGKILYVNHCR